MNCSPNDGVVHAKVLVGNFISEVLEYLPRNIRVLLSDFLWYMMRSFSNNFKVPYHRIKSLLVLQKEFKSLPTHILLDVFNAFQNVLDSKSPFPMRSFRRHAQPLLKFDL